MKKLTLIILVILAYGCKRNEFDVSPDQVAKRAQHGPLAGPGGPSDLDHLPPGAVKHEQHFKKGDRLPDGTIADGDRKLITVEMTGPATDAQGHKMHTELARIQSDK